MDRFKNTIIGTFILLLFAWSGSQNILIAQDHNDEQTTEVQSEHQEAVLETHEDIHADVSDETHEAEEFNATEVIMEHVSDSHDWHILTTKKGKHVSVPLPIILYSKETGLKMFMSSKIAHHHHYDGFQYGEDMVKVKTNKKGEKGEKSLDKTIVYVSEDHSVAGDNGDGIYYHGELASASIPLDFSITKNVFMMLLATIILLVVFLSLARSYKKTGISAPKGLQGFLEPIVIFIEDDVAKPNIGETKYKKYMPYLLTVFFFILIHNLLGLIPFFPFGANVTGNIAVTMVLAVCTLLITNISGNRSYWGHIFNPPGVPLWLYPIMIPVELLGIITKPFALMIRLFANITAGHIIVLSLVSMIFIFKSAFMAVPSGVLVLFMDMIELLVAFLQAYIFTLLSALFIGLAVPEHHHE
ncbi:F0F1 ATP synthase subunit A [Bacteroidota bacterium]